jgi:DNA-binding MarR family transcriptional regulator
MERDGWVTKAADASDGRITMVQLTLDGENLAEEIPLLLQNRFQGIREIIADEEKQAALVTLKKIRAFLGD